MRIKQALSLMVAVALLSLAAAGCAGGPLSPAVRSDIARQMVAQRPALSRCYTDALTRNRQATGNMTVNFTVTRAGGFSGLTISSSSISDPKLNTCVEEALASMRLGVPGPDRPVNVTYPVNFTPEAIP
ncbi:MAG: TonB family protein [Myxococcales bacterium]|nr:TonB family protein [Myxococcales bacterium]